ncbi:TolC family protein [Pedosphaera parvula]|uniref:Outer membrane efflux protein n=1 Tax=Pedosphaera parvula (strain Ellin514) TaxID=320771 RepID=B9XQN9_PEDPL|nr:TolC family protein [Pedosphaera parvula]EEF57821.1 outer membrane efflux protein [Pedosphaera parvula Ellin514]
MRTLLSLSLLGAAAFTGCATHPNQALQESERSLSDRTGAEVRWIRQEKDREEIEKLIAPLLQQELTAESAVRIAVLNNRSLQAEFEEVGISQAELIQAGLLKNPQFAASWRFPDRPHAGVDAEYSLAGDVLELIVLPLRRKVAARNLEQTELRVSDAVLKLAAEVETAFYELEASEQLLKRFRAISEVNEAAAELSKRQHEAGNITDLNLDQQQAMYAQSRVQISQTTRSIRQQRERLNRLMGLWGKDLGWKIADQLPEIPEQEIALEHLEKAAVQQRMDLAALKRRVDNTGYALSLRSKTRFVPSAINLGVDTERDPDGTRITGPTLDLELPIFDQGQGAVAKLQAEYHKAQRELEAMAVNIRSEVREARDLLIMNRDLARYYGQTLLPQRMRIVSETLVQYNAMQEGTFELLTAKEQEIQAEREYVEAWRDYWIARVELARAVGGKLNFKNDAPLTNQKEKANSTETEHNHHH